MIFRMESLIDAPAEEVFAWHARPEALTQLTPPRPRVRVESVVGEPLAVGTVVTLRLPFGLRWVARHTALEPGRMFRDEQERGPFRRWVHTHRFEPVEGGRCRLIDEVEYQVLCGRLVRPRIARLFAYRHAVTQAAFRAAGRDRPRRRE